MLGCLIAILVHERVVVWQKRPDLEVEFARYGATTQCLHIKNLSTNHNERLQWVRVYGLKRFKWYQIGLPPSAFEFTERRIEPRARIVGNITIVMASTLYSYYRVQIELESGHCVWSNWLRVKRLPGFKIS